MRTYGSLIKIDLATRRLTYFEGGRMEGRYPVGVGKSSTPTPTGNFAVLEKVMHPGGMLGTRWMGLSITSGNYGIHGTNNPQSIGGYVSNGCIRMHNSNVEELFPKVEIHTPVEIFSGVAKPAQESAWGGPQGRVGTHTVQTGETLWDIARKYGKDLTSIAQANNLTNPDVIYPGQIIIIP